MTEPASLRSRLRVRTSVAGLAAACCALVALSAAPGASARPATALLRGDYPATLTARLPAGMTMRRKSSVTMVFALHGHTVLTATLCDEPDGAQGVTTHASATANAVRAATERLGTRPTRTRPRITTGSLSRSVVVVRRAKRHSYGVLLAGGACVTSLPTRTRQTPTLRLLLLGLGGWIGTQRDDPSSGPGAALDPKAWAFLLHASQRTAGLVRTIDEQGSICEGPDRQCVRLALRAAIDPIARYQSSTVSYGGAPGLETVLIATTQYLRNAGSNCWQVETDPHYGDLFDEEGGGAPARSWQLSVAMAPRTDGQREVRWMSFWDEGTAVIDPLGRVARVAESTRHSRESLSVSGVFAYPDAIPHDLPSPACPAGSPRPGPLVGAQLRTAEPLPLR